MDRQLAAVALQFMQRMTVLGSDVPAFVAVTNALQAIASGAVVMQLAPDRPAAERANLRLADDP